MFLLSIFHLLQDVSNIELHASDERNLKYKGSHEVVKYITAFFLQIYSLIFFKASQNLIMSHRQFHHAINLSFQLIFIQLFEGSKAFIALSHFFSLILTQTADSSIKFDLMRQNL